METKSSENYLARIEELENRLAEAEQLIEAIKTGEVDAFAVNKDNNPEVYTIHTNDYAYRILVENFSAGALSLSEDGLIVYTNNYFFEFLNLPYENVIGKSIFQFIDSSSKDLFNELFKKGLTGQSKGEINLTIGQNKIPVYISLTSLYPNLSTVGMIVTDLSEKKLSETILEEKNSQLQVTVNQLRLTGEILRKSEERYHRMIQEVKEYSILSLSKEGIIENWNEGAERIKGYKGEEIIGKHFSTFYTEGDKQNKLPEKLLSDAILFGKATHEGWRIRKDGSAFWGSIVITALHDNENNITGFSKVTRDLTDKKRADDLINKVNLELKEKNEELQKMNEELQSFAYISSHDLQEPLRKIQTFSTRILEKEALNLSENGKMMFDRMQMAAKRMQTLIDDLLAYSRTNTQERKFEKVDLAKIVDEVKHELREEIKEKNAVIESNVSCETRVLPFQFRQLLNNLIGNSLKFVKPGTRPNIKIECKMVPGSELKNPKLLEERIYCHLTVIDNGIGFDPIYNEKIFELFQRLHGKEDYPGTGIGLSIVKRIVENHNGVISAKGDPGKGTRIDIYVPVS